MKTEQTIGVIGAGTMGTGIAQACALSGLPVVMIDVDETRVARGRDAISDRLARMVSKGQLPAGDRETALERLRGATDYQALRGCDFLIEAATENEVLKVAILQRMDAVAREDAVIATNTSSDT